MMKRDWLLISAIRGLRRRTDQTGRDAIEPPGSFRRTGTATPLLLAAALLAGTLMSGTFLAGCGQNEYTADRPDRVRPADRQVEYQRKEMIAFVHFGVNTFNNVEWGTGEESPADFNPTDFDPDQWARVLSENGFETLILTAKHHDGFALWPSDYTEHDVASSPWRDGEGDVVGAVAEAARAHGMDFGVYLSPWDMREPTYGTPAYNLFYQNQLRELLTRYGPIAEVWFDGAKGEEAEEMTYNFKGWWQTVREYQPDAVIFSDEGPNVRWIGNEHGFAGETNWSKIDRDSVTIGAPGQGAYLNTGQADGPDWVPGECDTSIRPGWFYHPSEDSLVKSVDDLMEIYYKSVGRNCTMLLNVPPTPEGRLHPTDVERLYAFSERLESVFDENLLGSVETTVREGAGATTDGEHAGGNAVDGEWNTFWLGEAGGSEATLEIELGREVAFDHIVLQEYIPRGQHIASFRVEAWQEEGWREIARGTTVGHKRILRTGEPVAADRIRLTVEETVGGSPAVSEIALYRSGDS